MSIATLDDLNKLVPMVAAFHQEEGISQSPDTRSQALKPLLRGSPLGEIHLIGPQRSPIGYVVISHGYSIEFGGPDAFIDEFYLRPAIRGRGLGSEVIDAIAKHLSGIGTRALHLEVAHTNERATRLYSRKGFARRQSYGLMTRMLE